MKTDLTRGSVSKRLILFALPLLLSNLLQALYNLADMLIVGWFSDTQNVAAVANGTQVLTLITNVVVGLSVGATVHIARLYGAKQNDQIKGATATTLQFFVVLGIIVGAILASLSYLIVRIMQVPQDTQKFAFEYIAICAIGLVFIFIFNAVSAALRALGNTKHPMYIIVVALVLNFVLDILFVKTFKMGARGAAIATVIAQGVCAALSLMLLLKNKSIYSVKQKPQKIHLNQIMQLGFPTAIHQAFVQLSFVVLISLVNTFGTPAAAAYGFATRINSFAVLPISAFMSAISSMTGQNMGANNLPRAVKTLKVGWLISFAFGVIMTISAFFGAKYLMLAFTTDAEVLALAVPLTRYFSFEYAIVSFTFCMHGFINGIGKTLITMLNGFLSSVLVRVPLAYLFSGFLGLNGVALSVVLSPILPIFIAFSFIMHYLKKQKSIPQDLNQTFTQQNT